MNVDDGDRIATPKVASNPGGGLQAHAGKTREPIPKFNIGKVFQPGAGFQGIQRNG